MVSGAAAILMEYAPDALREKIKAILLSSVDKIPSLYDKTVSGGRMNLTAALLALEKKEDFDVNFTAENVIGTPPLKVQFIDTTTGFPTNWRWNFGDGTYSDTQNPTHVYTGIGRYTVTLKAQNEENQVAIRKIVYVNTVRHKLDR